MRLLALLLAPALRGLLEGRRPVLEKLLLPPVKHRGRQAQRIAKLFALGFPHTLESNPAGFPVLRSGPIASYPILPTSETRSLLFDFEIYPGNSGGPVFLRFENRQYGGQIHFSRTELLVGMVSGETYVPPGLIEGLQERLDLRMAKVIHASLIKEAIELLPIPAIHDTAGSLTQGAD